MGRAKLAVIDEYGVLDPDAKIGEANLPSWLTEAEMQTRVKVEDLSDPESAAGAALAVMQESRIAPVDSRASAGRRRQPPASLVSSTAQTLNATGIIGMLPDGKGKVFSGASFNASQIGVSQDGVNFTWGANFAGGNGIATGFLVTPGGEALVSVKTRDNTNGKVYRTVGFNPATMSATSWSVVLTASKGIAHMDGKWGFTERSIAPLNSPGQGTLFVAEYDGDLAWTSLDDGVTWTTIFNLQTTLPGATHIHGIAYDRWDDRVWITVGDTAYAGIYYCNREDINGLATPWTRLTGSNSAAWQVTTVIPLALGVVFLSDATSPGVFTVARKKTRTYGPLRKAITVTDGTGHIGAHAFQASDDQPAYLTFYQSGSGQTPRIHATVDGLNFSTVFTDSTTVTSGNGIRELVGPDLDGIIWASRNITGTSQLVKLTKPQLLISPNGTRFSLTVGDDGALTTTAL